MEKQCERNTEKAKTLAIISPVITDYYTHHKSCDEKIGFEFALFFYPFLFLFCCLYIALRLEITSLMWIRLGDKNEGEWTQEEYS